MIRQYRWNDGQRLTLDDSMKIMGILNVTPDSFSDGGCWNTAKKASQHAMELVREGADVIDVGAESTRPGSIALTSGEESERLMQFLPAVLQVSSVPVSVDTYHWQTAEKAFQAGAHILNDIRGLQYDDGEMAEVAASWQVPVILMHNQMGTQYDGDIIECMKAFFSRSIEIALSHGIKEENIWLDPGIGFGKTENKIWKFCGAFRN